MWYIPGVSKWFRVRLSAYTSGTVTASVLFSVDQLPSIQNSNQVVTGSVSVTSGSIALAPRTSGALTFAKVKAAATTNATLLKASAGVVYGFTLSNTTAAAKYLKLFQKATAPVPGTDVPNVTYMLPPNSTTTFSTSVGFTWATGLGYSITGAVGDLDTTATAVDDVVGHILYA
jgi:hypothetical protein